MCVVQCTRCQVYPGVWIGNKAAAESAPLLASLGVTHLLNCAGGARDTAGGVTGRGTVRPDTAALAARGIQYRSELTMLLEFSIDIDIHCYVQMKTTIKWTEYLKKNLNVVKTLQTLPMDLN